MTAVSVRLSVIRCCVLRRSSATSGERAAFAFGGRPSCTVE